MLRRFVLFLCVVAAQLAARAEESVSCPTVPISLERLADMHVARADHSVFITGNEPTVVGGHTNGFVPTATAEYFSDGEWHLMETVYAHDHGFAAPLRSGQVLIGGGHAEPLGIGHIHAVEMYDPAAHSFRGFGCLDSKRCFATATEMDSGHVVISGNWFRSDDIEQFDGEKYFTPIGRVSQARACPYIFRIADGDALFFGNMDEHANPFDTVIVDRLKGEPLRVPLFDKWKPLRFLNEAHPENHSIGNYTYIIPVENEEGQVALCRMENTDFSLLPTSSLIPTEHDGSPIIYYKNVNVDRRAARVYLFGIGRDNERIYVLSVDIATSPSPVTLYYTEPMGRIVWSQPMLTTDGNLLVAGGAMMNADNSIDNFAPIATTLLLHVGNHADAVTTAKTAGSIWLWIVVGLLLAAAVVYGIYKAYKSCKWSKNLKTHKSEMSEPQDLPVSNLMPHISRLMDEQKLFLNADLKVADVAKLTGTNSSYVSACINTQRGCSFSQFVNSYRIEHAKQLLCQKPDKKIHEVATASGFSSETSFFRTFKAITGKTPSEWKQAETQKTLDTPLHNSND